MLRRFFGLINISARAPLLNQVVADPDPPVTLARLYEGVPLTAANQRLLYLRSTKTGPMTGFSIHLAAAMDGGDAIFNVRVNDVALFAGAGRPKIEDGDASVIVSGLDIDLLKGDEITLDLDDPGPSGVETPVSFMVEVE